MKKKINLTCETCIWHDDGLCDRLGYFVDPDDKCSEWDRIKENQSKPEKKKNLAYVGIINLIMYNRLVITGIKRTKENCHGKS